ncbi:hypothetical protein Q7P37_008178 [Cladosporium fusiforme]
MKLIITGATGRVGGGALQSALANSFVTSVIVLSRREIDVQHPKLQTIIKKDFFQYTPEEISQLEGAEACIWALGAPTSGSDVHVEYPHAAQRAFSTSLAPKTPTGKPFRFVLLSGGIVVRDQSRRLPPGLGVLKLRGQVEQDFVDFEAQNEKTWKSFIARPWMVVMPGSWMASITPAAYKIPVEVLGAALVEVAVSGCKEQTLDNAALLRVGLGAMDYHALPVAFPKRTPRSIVTSSTPLVFPINQSLAPLEAVLDAAQSNLFVTLMQSDFEALL